MIEQLTLLEEAISDIQKTVKELRAENERLKKEKAALQSTIDDRDLEILQLQEDAQKDHDKRESDKNEIVNRLQSLLGQMNEIAEETSEEQLNQGHNKHHNQTNNGFRF